MTTIAINPADLCPEAATLQAILLFKQGHPNRKQVLDDLTNVIHYATKLAELKPKSKDEIGIKDMQRRYDAALNQLLTTINTAQNQSLFWYYYKGFYAPSFVFSGI